MDTGRALFPNQPFFLAFVPSPLPAYNKLSRARKHCRISQFHFLDCLSDVLDLNLQDISSAWYFFILFQGEPTCRTAVQEHHDKLRKIADNLRLIMVNVWLLPWAMNCNPTLFSASLFWVFIDSGIAAKGEKIREVWRTVRPDPIVLFRPAPLSCPVCWTIASHRLVWFQSAGRGKKDKAIEPQGV